MADQFPQMSSFATEFAAQYKGFMKSEGITGAQIAAKLLRGEGYVSERVNGKRALDTNDVDALAMLVPGWDGRALMIELARRTRLAQRTGEIIDGRFPMRDEYDLVANETIDETPDATDADFDNA